MRTPRHPLRTLRTVDQEIPWQLGSQRHVSPPLLPELESAPQGRHIEMIRYCYMCSKPFTTDGRPAKWCSDSCRSKSYRERHAKPERTATWEYCPCGELNPLPDPLGGAGRKYCSAACRQRAYRQRVARSREEMFRDSIQAGFLESLKESHQLYA